MDPADAAAAARRTFLQHGSVAPAVATRKTKKRNALRQCWAAMAEWDEIATEALRAAQRLGDHEFWRSCASRAYYAAFSAVTFALREMAPFDRGRETPAHHRVIGLVQQHLRAGRSPERLRRLKAMLRLSYNTRIDADYRADITVDRRVALVARQCAYGICRELGVHDALNH